MENIFDKYFCCEGSTLEIDPFTGMRRIVWGNTERFEFDYGDAFSVEFYEDKMLLCFDTLLKKLQIGDCISLLFNDAKIIDLPITKKPVKDNHTYEISFIIYQEDLETLLHSSLVSYRVSYKSESKRPDIVEIGESLGPDAFRTYVKIHLDTIKQLVPDYKIPRRKIEKSTIDYKFPGCYVYLMKDTSNGYYKIGISNKPEYREKTLQSEKPTIEMLACKKFPIRKIAEAIESALHNAYSQQRLRGEWFNLNEEDVAAILETLK